MKTIKLLAFILGLTSIVTQIVFLRELVVIFYGNEVAYAVILGSWLFWIGIGSWLVSNKTLSFKSACAWVRRVFLSIALMLPLLMTCIRSLKNIWGLNAGEIISMPAMAVSALLILLPVCIGFGALFVLINKLAQSYSKEKGDAGLVNTVYLFESLGAVFGGLLFTFVFIHYFSAVQILFLIMTFCLLVFVYLRAANRSWIRPVVLCLLIVGGAHSVQLFDYTLRSLQWKGFTFISSHDSLYGNISAVKLRDAVSFFENGLFSFSTNDPLSAEETVHYAMLEHPRPKNVLLIGSGLGGAIDEVLKHPQTRVDYVELDAAVVGMAAQVLSPAKLDILAGKRVKMHHIDGRQFVKATANRYDVIVLNIGDPKTALLNRYYTVEFYKELARILSPGGIFTFGVASSANYLSDANRAYLRSLNSTLRQVFSDVQSLGGDTHIFLASNQRGRLMLHPEVLAQRYRQRSLKCEFVNPYYLPTRLDSRRRMMLQEVLTRPGQINEDARPIAYLFDIVLFSTHFNEGFKNLFTNVAGIGLGHLLFIPALMVIVGMLLMKREAGFAISTSIVTTGFSEIIFQVIVIMAFQALYGYAYYKIGLIVASFMGGLAIGSLGAGGVIKQGKHIKRTYLLVQVAICLYPLILSPMFFFFRDTLTERAMMPVFASAFAVMPVIAGFIGGLQYPLATAYFCAHKRKNDVQGKEDFAAQVAGWLYGFDVLGAAVGALVTGLFLIPLLGIFQVAVFCSVVNGAVLFLLLTTNEKRAD